MAFINIYIASVTVKEGQCTYKVSAAFTHPPDFEDVITMTRGIEDTVPADVLQILRRKMAAGKMEVLELPLVDNSSLWVKVD